MGEDVMDAVIGVGRMFDIPIVQVSIMPSLLKE